MSFLNGLFIEHPKREHENVAYQIEYHSHKLERKQDDPKYGKKYNQYQGKGPAHHEKYAPEEYGEDEFHCVSFQQNSYHLKKSLKSILQQSDPYIPEQLCDQK